MGNRTFVKASGKTYEVRAPTWERLATHLRTAGATQSEFVSQALETALDAAESARQGNTVVTVHLSPSDLDELRASVPLAHVRLTPPAILVFPTLSLHMN